VDAFIVFEPEIGPYMAFVAIKEAAFIVVAFAVKATLKLDVVKRLEIEAFPVTVKLAVGTPLDPIPTEPCA
jgi:hypothetical protein